MSRSRFTRMKIGLLLGLILAGTVAAGEVQGLSSAQPMDPSSHQGAAKSAAPAKASPGQKDDGRVSPADSVRAEKAKVREAAFKSREAKAEKRMKSVSAKMLEEAKARRATRLAGTSEGGRPPRRKDADPGKDAKTKDTFPPASK